MQANKTASTISCFLVCPRVHPRYWEKDTYIQETHRRHLGHELTVSERIRVDGQRLIYKHEITGPGEKRDEREIVFDL